MANEYGNEVQDRSQVVTRETIETIEWILPSLLKIFTSGDPVVAFAPTNEEDIEQAEQESEYVNFVVTQKNNWFTLCHTWFKDALLEKMGYVKVFWEEKDEYTDDYAHNPHKISSLIQTMKNIRKDICSSINPMATARHG